MHEININKSYEIFQIITDFGDPLEIFREAFQNSIDEDANNVICHVYEIKKQTKTDLIIDIIDNGRGLPLSKVACFFDLANSTKVDKNGVPLKGKLGYKGHGAKIFFNSDKIIIFSKTVADHFIAEMDRPLTQIQDNKSIKYSIQNKTDKSIELPQNWNTGFFLRIVNPNHFKTEHTKFKLNHKYLRDYCKWFTVFGSIKTQFDETPDNKEVILLLKGLSFDSFKKIEFYKEEYDPIPIIYDYQGSQYEKIGLGHYFPPDRYTETSMKKYSIKIASKRPYYDYYSRQVIKERCSCENNTQFDFIMNIEGYETKRLYDKLLGRRGKKDDNMIHTDGERYGLWACKSGIPVEKVDNWIEGGRGVGTYTFMHAFINCDDFQLTANRGSIHNTDIEKLELIKREINKKLSSQKIKDIIKERQEYEKIELMILQLDEEERTLKKRFNDIQNRHKFLLPNNETIIEPAKLKNGYSESETLILLIRLLTIYPNLFDFKLLDYDTRKGVDFVVEHLNNPKYIELKGTMRNTVNHFFRNIYKSFYVKYFIVLLFLWSDD